jgi:hypothetical protein
MKELSINQWVEKFEAGAFNASDVDTQCDAGWYDWFCRDSSLASKTKVLGKKVAQLSKSPLVNPDKTYVFFKNNCPMSGPLYDDFRICSLKTGDVIFTVVPKSGHSGKAEVWGPMNEFKEPMVEGTWNDVKAFFEV